MNKNLKGTSHLLLTNAISIPVIIHDKSCRKEVKTFTYTQLHYKLMQIHVERERGERELQAKFEGTIDGDRWHRESYH